MRTRSYLVYVVLLLLMIAGIACGAVPGANSGGEDEAEATTGPANVTEAIGQDEAAATPADVATDAEADQPTEAAPADGAELDDGLSHTSGMPDNVPVWDGNITDIRYVTEENLEFDTDGAYADVIAFYEKEMVANGWARDDSMSFELGDIMTIVFRRDTRRADVMIADMAEAGEKVAVAITITPAE
jgi:hypothetical protein